MKSFNLKVLGFLFFLSSCSSTSDVHLTKRGIKVCIDSGDRLENNLISSVKKVLPGEYFEKIREIKNNYEERGVLVKHQFGVDYQTYYINYFPVKVESNKGFVVIGNTKGTIMTSKSNLYSIIEKTYASCAQILELKTVEKTSFEDYFSETLLADGKTWNVKTSSSDKYEEEINQRAKALCLGKYRIFGCSAFASNDIYKNKCYVKCLD